ncbi:MAG: C-terminal binding protein [Actinobacteria bacterium]|nr:C-terminal binding protein [Actinomycetota bacterium]
MKVVLTDQVFPTIDTEVEILGKIGAELVVLDDPSPESIRANARDADALLNTYSPIDGETLGHLEKVKIIARYGIGVDNVDLEAARERGVVVTNVPDYCVDEVADHTLTLLLAVARKVVIGHAHVMGGGWGIDPVRPVHRLRGQTLGLVGFGNIARGVAARARPLGLEVLAFDPYVKDDVLRALGAARAGSLDELLGAADIVSVHVPLLPETRGLIGAEAIEKMRPGAIVLNTSRGPIVDVDAVVAALREGRLGGAGLDVFPSEPPDAAAFGGIANLVVTPHSAFYSDEAITESQTKAANNVVAVLRGEQPNYRVN